jgi:putative sigma-54 modulation protein
MSVKVEIVTHNLEINDSQKNLFTRKIEKLDRYLNEIDHVKLELTQNKSARSASDRFIAQITAYGHRAILRTEERSDDVATAFDSAIDKIQRQMERYKGKHFRGRGDGRSVAETVPLPAERVEQENNTIIRRKTFDLIPMNEAEALEQMKLLGHDNFFIFFNIETSSINVLYQRRDGSYGLIEPKVG